jgi:hypothetical protein
LRLAGDGDNGFRWLGTTIAWSRSTSRIGRGVRSAGSPRSDAGVQAGRQVPGSTIQRSRHCFRFAHAGTSGGRAARRIPPEGLTFTGPLDAEAATPRASSRTRCRGPRRASVPGPRLRRVRSLLRRRRRSRADRVDVLLAGADGCRIASTGSPGRRAALGRCGRAAAGGVRASSGSLRRRANGARVAAHLAEHGGEQGTGRSRWAGTGGRRRTRRSRRLGGGAGLHVDDLPSRIAGEDDRLSVGNGVSVARTKLSVVAVRRRRRRWLARSRFAGAVEWPL